MSPENGPPDSFGRTPGSAARAALVLALLGSAAVLGLFRALVRPHTPLGDVFLAAGIPPMLLPLAGLAGVVGVAAAGYHRAVRTAERFRIGRAGLEVRSPLYGEYVFAWENVARAELTPGGSLGLNVRDREGLLETHRGSERQRELLRTVEPFGEWDFLFHRAELGFPAETVLAWMAPHLAPYRAPDRGEAGVQ